MTNFLKETTNMNAPTLAYYVRTGEEKFIHGKFYNHPVKMINDISIDKNIPTKEMKDLLSNKKIEMRSSCEGDDLYGPFFIFRMIGENNNKKYIDKLCNYMNNIGSYKKIICKFGIGRGEGDYRIIVTSTFTKNEVNNIEYKKWWRISVEKLEILLNSLKE